MSVAPAPRPPRWRLRWRWLAALGILAALGLVADFVAWHVATAALLAGLPQAVETARLYGWVIEGGVPRRTGWPLRAVVEWPDVTATRDFGANTLRWTAERADLVLMPRDPRAVHVLIRGRQDVAWLPAPPLAFHAAGSDLRVPLSGSRTVTWHMRDLVTAPADGTAFQARALDVQATDLAVAADVAGGAFAPPLAAPFAGALDGHVRLQVNLPFPLAGTPAASATAWRDAGGQVDMPALDLHWGPLAVNGQGSGGLDRALQPQGRADVSVAGGGAVIEALGRAGMIAPGPASAARAVVSLLEAGSGGGAVPIPVQVQDRVVTVARFPLVRLPLVAWGP